MTLRRAVLVGAGPMGRAWAKNLDNHPAVQVVGWADLAPIRAQEAVADLALPDVAVDTDFRALVQRLRPDFVVDATSPESHREVVTDSLRLGAAVLGEKPMADSLDAGREMVRASEQSGLLYMVSQSRRYNPFLVTFASEVAGLGPLGILNADFYLGPHFGGFRDEMESPLLLDMAIHTFDAARLVGRQDAVSVTCQEFSPPWSWYSGDACANALFTLSGGARFAYRGSWCAEGRNTSWESEWRAVCARGSVTWDGEEAVVCDRVVGSEGFVRECDRTQPRPVAEAASGIEGSLAEFLRALETGEAPQGECHDNFKSLAMVFAAIESSRKGVEVAVPAH